MSVLSQQFVIRARLRADRPGDPAVFPFTLPAVQALDGLDFHPGVTFLMGENGSGKSTILEALAIALGFNAEGGSRNMAFSTRSSHSALHEHIRVAKGMRRPKTGYFLRAESFFNVATHIDDLDTEPAPGPPIIASYGGVSLHEQSHGESFMALMLHRFVGQGVYILDEPEAALSPQRQLAALKRMHDLVAEGAQFIVATHSPILMGYPDAWIYECSARGLQRIDYEDTEHVQITRRFLNDRQRTLERLLRD
jgi:predicted ATPase